MYLMLALAILAPGVLSASSATTTYSIETTWNGEAVDHDPATVTLSTNPQGELVVEASAPFFNSPLLPEDLLVEGEEQCPQRPHGTLYNYEVVEAFFLNDEEEYLELEFSPQGLYLFIMLDGYRNDVLSLLPIMPQGANYSELCETTDCNDRWTTSAAIPRQYLPFQVTRWNAYAIHGSPWGSDTPDLITYESLYPADPSVVPEPDFHYLEGFQEIDLEEAAGYVQSDQASELWSQALSGQDYTFSYDLNLRDDCLGVPDGFSASARTFKSSESQTLYVDFEMDGGSSYYAYVPEELQEAGENGDLTTETESFWISLTGSDGSQLRYGINPYNADRTISVSAGGDEEDAGAFPGGCDADEDGDGRVRGWACNFQVDMGSMPAGGPVAVPMLLSHAVDGAEGGDEAFAVALCPGFPPGASEYDWVGCEVDPRSLYNL